MTALFSSLARRPKSFPPAKICASCMRRLSQTAYLQSGHSRWSTIKHDKARADASRSKQRAALTKDLCDASRMLGADPAFNPRLADAIQVAKRAGLPKVTIETAIARGQGKSHTGATLEHVTLEAVLPPVALMVDCQTDSKMRTLKDLRTVVKACGGTATPTSYLFEKRGRVVFHAEEETGVEEVLEPALEAGALDVEMDDQGRILVDCEPQGVKEVETKISTACALEVASSESIWCPRSETAVEREEVDDELLDRLEKLQNELAKFPEVQRVYMNMNIELFGPHSEEDIGEAAT